MYVNGTVIAWALRLMIAQFQCLFIFGHEHRAANVVGVLAMGHAGSPTDANILANDAKIFAKQVAIYITSNEALTQSIEAAAQSKETRFDERKIIRLIKNEDCVGIEFEDGEKQKRECRAA
jgi:ABC-type iron transport system FetAB permease component